MFENDYVWMLKTLSNAAININDLYNLRVKIPEIILLKTGEPKFWFYQEKDEIKTRNENYLKLRLVKEYFADPQAVNDPQVFDFDFMMYNSKQTPSEEDAKKVLFCVVIENASQETKVIKKITKKVADELFSRFQDNVEYCKQWTKVFTYLPSKLSGLFDVCLTRSLKEENPKVKIIKRDYSLPEIKTGDFSKEIKEDGKNKDKRLFPKNDKMVSDNNFPSIAGTINTVIEKTVKSLAKFLESKTKLTLGELNLEVIVDANNTVWLIGSKGIYFYNNEGDLDRDTEKENLEFPKVALKHFFKCPGSYCQFLGETNFYQEGDEATHLYDKKERNNNNNKDKNQKKEKTEKTEKMEKKDKKDKSENKKPKNQVYEIPYKSILLDVIERCKQYDRLSTNFPELNSKQILSFVETHPFDLRKFSDYSIGEILQSYLFKGYRVSNMYENIHVCQTCHFIYEKIDGYRTQNILKPQNRKFDKEEAKAILDKYFEKNPSLLNINQKDRKKIFSKAFESKLGNFDKSIIDILGLERKTENVESFFELTAAKMRKLSPITTRSNGFSKSVTNTPPSVKFPIVYKEIIKDPDNIVNREKLKIGDKAKAEVVGYKHFLGHAQYLTDSRAGLNKLQDKLNRFNYAIDNIVGNLSEKDNERGSEQKSEDSEDKLELNVDDNTSPSMRKRMKELELQISAEQSSSKRKSPFNVAVDKIDFFSEKEKAELFEKENKKKEKETQQKNFLARHNLLAQSILANSAITKKSSSPKIVFKEADFHMREEEEDSVGN